MENPLVDFSYVYELSGNDKEYIVNVINLFLSSFTPKLAELTEHIQQDHDFVEIEECAHFLKSSSAVVKIRDVYDTLVKIEHMARAKSSRSEIRDLLDIVSINFNSALPILNEEVAKNQVAG